MTRIDHVLNAKKPPSIMELYEAIALGAVAAFIRAGHRQTRAGEVSETEDTPNPIHDLLF